MESERKRRRKSVKHGHRAMEYSGESMEGRNCEARLPDPLARDGATGTLTLDWHPVLLYYPGL